MRKTTLQGLILKTLNCCWFCCFIFNLRKKRKTIKTKNKYAKHTHTYTKFKVVLLGGKRLKKKTYTRINEKGRQLLPQTPGATTIEIKLTYKRPTTTTNNHPSWHTLTLRTREKGGWKTFNLLTHAHIVVHIYNTFLCGCVCVWIYKISVSYTLACATEHLIWKCFTGKCFKVINACKE